MRIIEEDSKLGITKVVWKFDETPNLFEIQGETPVNDPTAVEPQYSDVTEDTEPTIENHHDASQSIGDEEPVANGSENPVVSSSSDIHLGDMRQQIQFLQQVIESQNQQLKTKDELIRNFQVLLKTEQEQVCRLEARTQETMQVPTSSAEGSGWLSKLKNMLTKH